MRPTVRRLVAFAVDYFVIVAYLVALTGASIAALASPLGARYRQMWTTAGSAELAGFVLLTAPVVLYFVVCEASARGATLGKHALHLRVEGVNGRQLTVGRALLRSSLKFLPWELAHFSIWQYIDASGRAPGWATVTLVAAYGLAAIYLLSLAFGSAHRTVYDRVSGSTVRDLRI